MYDPIKINSASHVSQNQGTKVSQTSQDTQDIEFKRYLENAQVSFSNHAQKRLEIRSIEMNESNMERLNTAIDKAERHGGKESLILMDDLAFIVNVQKRMVVTTMDMNQKKDGVFTHIDTVVIADEDGMQK